MSLPLRGPLFEVPGPRQEGPGQGQGGPRLTGAVVGERGALRVGGRLGKYRLRRRLGRGGSADVFAAFDTLERVTVALKVPAADRSEADVRADFERELRVAARLDHPNVLRLKNADVIDGRLVITDLRMGQESRYIFRHVVAEQDNPHWRPITPERMVVSFDRGDLASVFERILNP